MTLLSLAACSECMTLGRDGEAGVVPCLFDDAAQTLEGGVDLVEGDLAEARAHIRAGRACVGGRLECDSRQREHAGGLGLVADQIVRIALGSALARGRKLETDPEEHACRRTHPVGNRGRRTQNAVRRCLESFQSILHPAEDETWSANGNVKGRVKGRLRTW